METERAARRRADDRGLKDRRTFIMSMMVFMAIMTMMKYSNGDETTRRQTRNLNDRRFLGM